MSKITKIVDFENHRDWAVVLVELDDGMSASVYIGGDVEVYHDPTHDKIKAFVKRKKD